MFIEVEYASKEKYIGTGGIQIGGTYYKIISISGSDGVTVGCSATAYLSHYTSPHMHRKVIKSFITFFRKYLSLNFRFFS